MTCVTYYNGGCKNEIVFQMMITIAWILPKTLCYSLINSFVLCFNKLARLTVFNLRTNVAISPAAKYKKLKEF